MDIAVGDWVLCAWTTKQGRHRDVIGEVIAVKPSRTGPRVHIRYERTSQTRTNFSWAVHEIWRPMEQCKKLKPQGKSEGQAFAEAIINAARDNA